MTVLDIVSRYRATESVFKRWDRRAGVCICCQALFDTLQQVADRCGLELDRLLAELNAAAADPQLTHCERYNMAENDASKKPLRLTETVKGAG